MLNKKKIFIVFSVLILSVLVYVFTPQAGNYFRLKRAAEAVGSFPYQIGLTNVVVISCFVVPGPPPFCSGGTYCYLKDAATCTMYSEVSGTPAGGMGSNALLLNTAIAQAGLTPGGQLIAGGMGPTTMDSGILASTGGCAGSGCVVIKTGPIKKFKNWVLNKVNDFIIAGNKETKK